MNATHGLPRRPGESPPNLPAAERAAAYFGGRLSLEDLETLQDDLAHDPNLAETLLDWQCFAPPSADSVPTATLTLWQSEDKARLDVAISEEREAREEAARLIGIPVEDLGRVPPPPAPTFSAEEQQRARRAIERLRPLSAAERLELVRREPEAFAGEAVASACLVEARAALPVRPEESREWAEIGREVALQDQRGTSETWRLVCQLRSEAYMANAWRCLGDFQKSGSILVAANRKAEQNRLTDLWYWADSKSFEASLKRDARQFDDALKASLVSLGLWEHAGNSEAVIKALWLRAGTYQSAGHYAASVRAISDALDLAITNSHLNLLLPLRHALTWNLLYCRRVEESARLFSSLQSDYLDFPHWEPYRQWLSGALAEVRGEASEVEIAFSRSREELVSRGSHYDAALVTLEWCLFLLSRNRVDEVLPLAVSMGKTFEALGVGRETLASWAILREAAERRELTQAIVRQVQEEISRPGAFRVGAAGAAGGGPLAKAERLDHDLRGTSAGPRTMDNVNRFPAPPGKTADSTDERSASYFAGALSEAEAEKYQDQLANDPELAESLLDFQAFSGPTAEVVSPEELASWQAADRIRLQAAIDAEGADAEVTPVSPVLQFPAATTTPPPKRHAWKWLAASAGLAAGLGGVMFATAPVPETYIVPVSTLRGDDDVTTLELGRWPHKALFRIDARTLGEIAEPQAALLDSMTDAVVATTTAKPCGEALCAQFWGLSPGNYRLELNDLATGQPRLVAYHPVELLATDRAP